MSSGQTLAAIAELYGVSVERLKADNGLNNRATVVGCETQCRQHTGARHGAAERAAGERLPGRLQLAAGWESGGQEGWSGEDAAAGAYTHILQASGPRAGSWWFWIENKDDKRISEMAHVRTHGALTPDVPAARHRFRHRRSPV